MAVQLFKVLVEMPVDEEWSDDGRFQQEVLRQQGEAFLNAHLAANDDKSRNNSDT